MHISSHVHVHVHVANAQFVHARDRNMRMNVGVAGGSLEDTTSSSECAVVCAFNPVDSVNKAVCAHMTH